MRKTLLLSSLLGLATCLFALPVGAATVVGKPAPALHAKLLDGSKFDLSAQKGKVVLISFWATWCGPCREEMPAMEAYYKSHKKDGLELIAISMDDPPKDKAVRALMRTYSFLGALNREADFAGYGHVYALPMSFVVDRDGVLHVDGSQNMTVFDAQKLDKIITPLLKSKPGQTSERIARADGHGQLRRQLHAAHDLI